MMLMTMTMKANRMGSNHEPPVLTLSPAIVNSFFSQLESVPKVALFSLPLCSPFSLSLSPRITSQGCAFQSAPPPSSLSSLCGGHSVKLCFSTCHCLLSLLFVRITSRFALFYLPLSAWVGFMMAVDIAVRANPYAKPLVRKIGWC